MYIKSKVSFAYSWGDTIHHGRKGMITEIVQYIFVEACRILYCILSVQEAEHRQDQIVVLLIFSWYLLFCSPTSVVHQAQLTVFWYSPNTLLQTPPHNPILIDSFCIFIAYNFHTQFLYYVPHIYLKMKPIIHYRGSTGVCLLINIPTNLWVFE